MVGWCAWVMSVAAPGAVLRSLALGIKAACVSRGRARLTLIEWTCQKTTPETTTGFPLRSKSLTLGSSVACCLRVIFFRLVPHGLMQ